MISDSFWRGKKVLLTGHTGFKGAWLAFWLKSLGADITGVALEPATKPSAFSALGIEKQVAHHICDIRDQKALAAIVVKTKPDIAFHLAAQALVRTSYKNPIETYETNVIGTGNLLLALKDISNLRATVVVTSDKAYENRERDILYTEDDHLGGFDPYSSSKACTEIITASFRRSFFSSASGLATARAGNVIGGGDWSEDRLIPDLVRAADHESKLEIRYPDSIRPWQHVLVPLSGYLELAEKLFQEPARFSQAYNFAPHASDCIPVRDILASFGEVYGRKINWFETNEKKPHEAHFLKLSAAKADKDLGWSPAWDLKTSLKATADWYRTYRENPSAIAALTTQQIRDFTANLK